MGLPLVLFLARVASVPAVGVESGPPFEHAANRLAAVLAMRYCLLIVKDGAVVHENYFHNGTHTMYEFDSLGKTAIAQVRHSSSGASLHSYGRHSLYRAGRRRGCHARPH